MDDFSNFAKLIKNDKNLRNFIKDLNLEDEMNEPWSWAAPFLFYAKYLIDTNNLFNTIAFYYKMPFNDPFGIDTDKDYHYSVLNNLDLSSHENTLETIKILQEMAFKESADGCCIIGTSLYKNDAGEDYSMLFSRIEMVNRHWINKINTKDIKSFKDIINFQKYTNDSFDMSYGRILPRNFALEK
jgi:hypothetical protein